MKTPMTMISEKIDGLLPDIGAALSENQRSENEEGFVLLHISAVNRFGDPIDVAKQTIGWAKENNIPIIAIHFLDNYGDNDIYVLFDEKLVTDNDMERTTNFLAGGIIGRGRIEKAHEEFANEMKNKPFVYTRRYFAKGKERQDMLDRSDNFCNEQIEFSV